MGRESSERVVAGDVSALCIHDTGRTTEDNILGSAVAESDGGCSSADGEGDVEGEEEGDAGDRDGDPSVWT